VIYALGDRKPVLEGDGHFIAPTATLIGSVRLGPDASVWFNCVLRGDNDWISIGERSNIQDGSVLHTDPGLELVIGHDATIGHKVMLHGCSIGDRTLVGIGSTILNGARIGSHCVVGAQSLVTEGKEFPDGTLILGSPARVIRDLDADELGMLERSAAIYVANAARYRQSLLAL
jgi:carbonic anhydrase/acetyltransferase-like protein (isoleucine patch superfamily)